MNHSSEYSISTSLYYWSNTRHSVLCEVSFLLLHSDFLHLRLSKLLHYFLFKLFIDLDCIAHHQHEILVLELDIETFVNNHSNIYSFNCVFLDVRSSSVGSFPDRTMITFRLTRSKRFAQVHQVSVRFSIHVFKAWSSPRGLDEMFSTHDFIPRWPVLCKASTNCKYLQSSVTVDSHHENWEFIVLHSLIDIVTDDYHVRNLVRSDSIVSIFLESVLLVKCHSYFSKRYHPKLAVYVCRFPYAQWSQRRGNSVPSVTTSGAYYMKIHSSLSSSSPSLVFVKKGIHVLFPYLSENVFVHLNLFLRWSWKEVSSISRSSLLLDNVNDVVLGRWLQGQLSKSRTVS